MITEIEPQRPVKAFKIHRCSYCRDLIRKGTTYYKSRLVFDRSFYTWKSHFYCQEIAQKLKMHQASIDAGYEGLDSEWFREEIVVQYQDMMLKNHREIYESKEFIKPIFNAQLKAVLTYHQIEIK